MTTFEDTDTNKNGVIEREEWRQPELEDKRRKMDDEDAKRDSQRKMVWFALSGMVMYPVAVVTCSIAGFDTAAQLLHDIANIYLVSVSALLVPTLALMHTRHAND
ncbi:MAG: hypothetical protein CM15mV106_230 [uncultured marine virus]|nr:MAG: hypothetical protein CM15mV106_230 [uncultured marine virus]